MRFYLQCAALLIVAGGVAYYKRAPRPLPVSAGPELNLPRPAASAPARAAVESAMLVTPEDRGMPQPRRGRPRKPPTLGVTPLLFDRARPDAPLVEPRDEPSEDGWAYWENEFKKPRTMGAIVAFFMLMYVVLARALRRGGGPGGRGFTHD